MMKPKRFDYVEIIWVDSAHSSGWKYKEDIDTTLVPAKSCGIYWTHQHGAITIVQSHCQDRKAGNFQVDGLMTIPRVAIRKIRVLERPEN